MSKSPHSNGLVVSHAPFHQEAPPEPLEETSATRSALDSDDPADYGIEVEHSAPTSRVEPHPPTPLDYTDTGNAERILRLFRDRLRIITEANDPKDALLVWTGTVWVRGRKGAVALAMESAKSLKAQASKWATRSLSRERLYAAVDLIPTLPEARDLNVSLGELDQAKDFLPVENGVIDLRTGAFGSHRPELLFTKVAPVTFDASTRSPQWLQFVRAATVDEDGAECNDTALWLQTWLGYCLTGRTDEQAFAIFHGPGGNGKGVIDRTMIALLGAGTFAAVLEPNMLADRDEGDAEKPTPHLMKMRGARWVGFSELRGRLTMDATKLKKWTGGDHLTGRGMRENSTTWEPTHKLQLATNPLPLMRDIDEALSRRPRVLKLNAVFAGPKANAAPTFENEATMREEEASGILNWLVLGARRWYELRAKSMERARQSSTISQPMGRRPLVTGLPPCPAVARETAAFLNLADPLQEFVNQCMVQGEHQKVRAVEIYAAYTEWSSIMGQDPMSRNAFGRELTRRKVPVKENEPAYRSGWRLSDRGRAMANSASRTNRKR